MVFTPAKAPYLPTEIILQIIDSLILTVSPTPIALPSTHPITKALLSLAQTSHLTSLPARLHLYKHCMHVTSFQTLQLIRRTLSTSPQARDLQRHITSLHFSPFQSERITSFAQVQTIVDFLTPLAPNVKRFIFKVPLSNIQIETYIERKIARLVFSCLAQFKDLEVFLSVNDGLSMLRIGGYHVCDSWKKLRILGVYNPDFTFTPWECARLPNLERLVVTRPNAEPIFDTSEEGWEGLRRGLELVFVDLEGMSIPRFTHRNEVFGLKIRLLDIPRPGWFDVQDDTDLFLLEWAERSLQEWVEQRFAMGDEFAL